MSNLTDLQVAYTMLAQGIKGQPQTLKACVYQNMVYTNAFGATLNVEIGQSIIFPIKTWAGITEYNTWVNNPQNSENFFLPQKIINNIHGLNIHGQQNSGGVILIQPFDENGSIITNLGSGNTSPAFLTYEANCVDVIGVTQDRLEQPITLTLVADIDTMRCYFSFFAPFSHSRKNEYNISSNVYCHINSGSTYNIVLIGNMIDPADVADPEGGAPTGDADGGGGLYDYPYTPIDEPQLPQFSVCDTGMVSLYSVNSSQMYQLANKLWSSDFFDSIIKNFYSPMDNIISLHVIPFVVYGGTQANIHVGNYDTEIPSNLLATSYFKLDCGNISLDGAYKTFADYSNTEIALYLPYIGIVPLSPDDCMDKTINVKYNIDVFSGACVAYVRSLIRGRWTVLNQYQGSIVAQYPITGANYTNVYVGMMSGVAHAVGVGAMLTSAPTAPNNIGNAIGEATGAIQSIMNAKPSFQRSGGISSTAGLMSVQIPYLIVTKPNFIQGQNFRELKGYVSNLTCRIGDESGFISATVNNEMLTNINCTDRERTLIKQALANGVYI